MIIAGENFPGVGWGEGGHQGKFVWLKFTGIYMRRILKCTYIDIDLHQKNLHSPNP